MSHFYLQPFLLSQGYSPFQISQILLSFSFFENHSFLNQNFLFMQQFFQQNIINRPLLSKNLIIQRSNQALSKLQEISKNIVVNTEKSEVFEQPNPIKQSKPNQQKTSIQLVRSKDYFGLQRQNKRIKRKNIKKISIQQKRQKQLRRNQTQNLNRNVIPNQVHQMLTILFKKSYSACLVEKLLKKYTSIEQIQSLSVHRFYLYQNILKQKINHYVSKNSLRILLEPLEPDYKIYSKQEQSVYRRIGLSLIYYFLHNKAAMVILNSKRIKSENKLQHLKSIRYLTSLLNEYFDLYKQFTNSEFNSDLKFLSNS